MVPCERGRATQGPMEAVREPVARRVFVRGLKPVSSMGSYRARLATVVETRRSTLTASVISAALSKPKGPPSRPSSVRLAITGREGSFKAAIVSNGERAGSRAEMVT